MLRITTSLQNMGNSYILILPPEILQAALFNEYAAVEILADASGIKIQKVQKAETLDDLFKNYIGTYKCQEVDIGIPVGKEVIKNL